MLVVIVFRSGLNCEGPKLDSWRNGSSEVHVGSVCVRLKGGYLTTTEDGDGIDRCLVTFD